MVLVDGSTLSLIDAPALAERRISGVFDVDDPAALILGLTATADTGSGSTPQINETIL